MITKEMLKTVKLMALGAVLAPMLMGCPKTGLSVGYEGVYRGGDGVELTIVAGPFKSGAQLSLPGGKKLIGKAAEYSYDTLVAAKPGYLSRPIVKGSNIYEAFLVMPKAETKVTKGDTILIDTDVVYLRYDSKVEGTVQTVTITYSSKGKIQLDSVRREIERGAPSKECRKDCQVGWDQIVEAPEYTELQLTRVEGAEPKIEFPSQ